MFCGLHWLIEGQWGGLGETDTYRGVDRGLKGTDTSKI